MQKQNILDIENLFVRFYTYEGTVRAIEGINLGMREGETLGIVGETGCGKSVTSLSILVLVPQPGKIEEGKIIFNPRDRPIDLLNQKEEALRGIRGKDIAMIFQEPRAALNPVFTIENQISEVFTHHRKKEMIQRTLEKLERDIENSKRIEDTIEDLETINTSIGNLKRIDNILNGLKSIHKNLAYLKDVQKEVPGLKEIKKATEGLDKYKKTLESLKNAEEKFEELRVAEKDLRDLKKLNRTIKSLRSIRKRGKGTKGIENNFEGLDYIEKAIESFQGIEKDIRGSRIGGYKRFIYAIEKRFYRKMLKNPNAVSVKILSRIPILRRYQGRLKKEIEREVVKILKEMRIADPARVAKMYPHELSGGMAQRAVIAMALSCSPTLLICDEPTTNLDVTVQAQILHLIKELKKDFGSSILYITHDMGVVAELCDRVAVMYAGTVVELADVGEIFQTPLHPYTRALLDSIPRPGKEFKSIEGTVPSLIEPPIGCRFHPRCPRATELCAKAKPKMMEVKKDHFVECHLYEGSAN